MAYLNKAMLIGNIGKDPAIAVGQTGRKHVSFSIATTRRYRDNNGEMKEQTDWHNIVGWGKMAEVFEKLNVKKGACVYVEGAITNRSYTDQATGAKKYTTEITIENFQLLGGRAEQAASGAQNGGNAYSSHPTQNAAQGGQRSPEQADDDEDLPF